MNIEGLGKRDKKNWKKRDSFNLALDHGECIYLKHNKKKGNIGKVGEREDNAESQGR